ncbi:hypothetical protein [Paenirhodobacter sp.]|uniref:hypothetical protein n=1 Tax=Paenirhodobacter sp. TaxID=1965326 RepID=UPI003B414FAF
MTPEERVAAAERETADTQRAAVRLAVKLIDGYKTPPERKEHLARLLIVLAGSAPNPAEAQLARLVAAALRRGV